MAFTANPQLLIHEGELNEIIRIIKAQKDSNVKIVGHLFGLWRHSLTQPVVHLINGPGARAKISKVLFAPDFGYSGSCKEYLRENHGLLQIGLWCCGSIERYPRLNPQSPDFRGITSSIMPDKGNCIVLLFVNTEPSLSMDFYIINRCNPHESFVSCKLRHEDMLSGPSSFRSLQPILDRINRGAMFPSKQKDQKSYFSSSEFQQRSVQAERSTPVRESSEEQWYESTFGEPLLAKLLETFRRNHVSVTISRNTMSRDLTFELNEKLFLNFPREYPEKEVTLSWADNERDQRSRNQTEISMRLVGRVLRVLPSF